MPIDLMTGAGAALHNDPERQPWSCYPRPQMRRDNYLNLNGWWDFCASWEKPEHYNGQIRVPFCPESRLSGIGEHFEEGIGLWYRRWVTLPDGIGRGRWLLHIGAADQITDVFVNGCHAGHHTGGYEAMCFDITAWLQKDNEIVICVTDDLRGNVQPYGKQTLKRGGMWYTPVSGIWQSVWMENVPDRYIRKLQICNRGTSVTVDVGDKNLCGKVTVAGVGEFLLEAGMVTITPEKPRLWSPEDPYLYQMTVEAGEDRLQSYFALRTLEIKNIGGIPRLCLNGKPYFFHGLLDQGYWPDGLFTPAEPDCYSDDILAMKKLGFNMLRKHIKVEPEQFYYDCDRLGMVVFQDMVNNGDYSFLRDTALPTAGLQKMPDGRLHGNPATRQAFIDGMSATVNQLKNHPSILYWTIFNEGWGQFDSSAMYDKLRQLDDTRWIDSTSGWFRCGKTDVESLHCYFKKYRFKKDEKPVVLSEFGGFSHGVGGHLFNTEKSYGYGSCKSLNELAERIERLYADEIVPAAKHGLCASVYTQVSDVEDEINGLVTYDRKVEKLTPERMLPIAKALQDAVK